MTELLLPQGLLVDQDGTLIDSEPIWEDVEFRFTEELGGTLTRELRDSFIGGPIEHTANSIKELTGTDMSHEDIAHTIIERVAQTIEREGACWLPGVGEFLQRMQNLRIPIVVVTASVHRIADAVMVDCPVDAISTVIAGDDVDNVKPHPEGYIKAAQRLGLRPEECIAIEDSRPGMTAAHASGARTIIVPGHQKLDLLPGVSRVRSIHDVTPEFLDRIMRGEVIDLMSEQL